MGCFQHVGRLSNKHEAFVQECTYMEHVSHQTVVLCNAMDSQRQMLTALLDGVDEYVETLKRTLATVRELSDDIRSNYR